MSGKTQNPSLPHSIEAERGVIGALLLEPQRIRDVGRIIGPEDFTDPRHAVLFAAVERMTAENKPVDLVTVTEELTQAGKLEQAGDASYVTQIVTDTPTAQNCDYLTGIVARHAAQRHLMAVAEDVREAAVSPSADIPALTRDAAKTIREIGERADMGNKTAMIEAGEWLDVDPPAINPIVEGVFEAGDKASVVGSSKARKSFFVLQFALSLATGRKSFLGWDIPKACRVLMVQLEVKAAHYQRRVHYLAFRMGITRADLGDRLKIVNARGKVVAPDMIETWAREHGADVVIVDPVYKLMPPDANENDTAAWRPILAAFDRITEETGAAVLYVHHNPKGHAGDRATRDRGAGSGVVARDYDAGIYLTDQRDKEDCFVVQSLVRNFPPREAFTIRFEDQLFALANDIPPIEKTSANSRPKVNVPDDAILAAVGDGEKAYGDLVQAVRAKGYSVSASKEGISRMLAAGKLTSRQEPVFPKRTFYRRSDGVNQRTDQREQ